MWKLVSRFGTMAVPWWVGVLDSGAFFLAWFYSFFFLLGQKQTGPLVIELWCVSVSFAGGARFDYRALGLREPLVSKRQGARFGLPCIRAIVLGGRELDCLIALSLIALSLIALSLIALYMALGWDACSLDSDYLTSELSFVVLVIVLYRFSD